MSRKSEDISRAADALQLKLSKLRKEARRLKRIEEHQEAEAQRQKDIAFALQFLEVAKIAHLMDSEETIYDVLSREIEKAAIACSNAAIECGNRPAQDSSSERGS